MGETLFSNPTSVAGSQVPSPYITSVGLKSPGATGFVETLAAINTEMKIASIPGTPNLVPDWSLHEPTKDAASEAFLDKLEEKRRLERQSNDLARVDYIQLQGIRVLWEQVKEVRLV